jgi:hypothetical protein
MPTKKSSIGLSLSLNSRPFVAASKLLLFALIIGTVILTENALAATLNVPSSQYPTVQSAVNAANPGDTIVLQAGTNFVESVTLKVKPGNSFITIQSSAMNSLPPEGYRVTPAMAQFMPKLINPGFDEPALLTEAGAHHYRIIGVEIRPGTNNPDNFMNDLVRLGSGDSDQNTLAKVPHNIIIDRCYIHGLTNSFLKNGISLQSTETQIINSHISEVFANGYESHAIALWNTPGKVKIANNYLSAASIVILIGGAGPSIPSLVPSDIEIRHNYIYKPWSWFSASLEYVFKNFIELKAGRRVQISGNYMENSWSIGDQDGPALVLTPRVGEGQGIPQTEIRDVTFSRNVVRRVGLGVHGVGRDDVILSQDATLRLNNVRVENNLFRDIVRTVNVTYPANATTGSAFTFGLGTSGINISHNTILQKGDLIRERGTIANNQAQYPNLNFSFTNNLSNHNIGGVWAIEAVQTGGQAFQTFFPNYVYSRNVIGFSCETLPAAQCDGYGGYENYFPNNGSNALTYPFSGLAASAIAERPLAYPRNSIEATAGFVSTNGDNYRLSPNSPYRNKATTNKDIGVDYNALNPSLRTADFNSDAKTEIAVWRPSNGTWYILSSDDNSQRAFQWGQNGDVPAAGDYDGDGQTDYAIFRPGSGTWAILHSSGCYRYDNDSRAPAAPCSSRILITNFGQNGDIPVPGDYDGDGKTDIAVFRPSNGGWYHLKSSGGGFGSAAFGQAGDKPVQGDYDGDGKTDVAVYRPSNGGWYFIRSFNNSFGGVQFGASADVPVPGDYDGDGKLDYAVWRPSDSTYYVLNARTGANSGFKWGLSSDIPVKGDYDGDGKFDYAVFRPGTQTWHINHSGNSTTQSVAWGASTDVLIPSLN